GNAFQVNVKVTSARTAERIGTFTRKVDREEEILDALEDAAKTLAPEVRQKLAAAHAPVEAPVEAPRPTPVEVEQRAPSEPTAAPHLQVSVAAELYSSSQGLLFAPLVEVGAGARFR